MSPGSARTFFSDNAHVWDLRNICDTCAGALQEEARRRDEEHSPYGIDSLEELALHALLRDGLRAAGYCVLPEQRYPHFRSRRRRSEGDRCDLVLTRGGDGHLRDPLAVETLFGDRGADPTDALWIEVKMAHQFGLIEGVADAGRSYSSQLLGAAVRDLRKMARDPSVEFAGLLLVMFNKDEFIAARDLAAWLNRCLDLELPIASPIVERFAIADRIGNSVCSVTLTPINPART